MSQRSVTSLLILGLLLAAWSGVYLGTASRPGSIPAGTVWCVVDVSRSMLCRDLPDGRLGTAKRLVSDMAATLSNYRRALITFAGDAAVLVPPTFDASHFQAGIEQISIDAAPVGGSNLPAALERIDELTHVPASEDPPVDLVLILSDGGHEAWPTDQLVRLAQQNRWLIVTVGLGDPNQPWPVPIEDSPTAPPIARQGQPVVSRLNEAPLRQLAAESDGLYVPVQTQPVDVAAIVEQSLLPKLNQEVESQQQVPVDRYWWLVLAALGLAVMLARAR